MSGVSCPRGCVDTEGCGCEWNATHERGSLFPFRFDNFNRRF